MNGSAEFPVSASWRGFSRYALILLALGFFIAGKLLLPFPADPDSLIGSTQIIGTGCLFGFWLLGVCGWGRVLRRVFLPNDEEDDAGIILGLGTGAAALFAMLLGHLGLIGIHSEAAFDLALVLGLLVDGKQHRASPVSNGSLRLPRGCEEWAAVVPWLVLSYWALALILKAAIPHFQSDPLLQHLLGPRLWFQDGAITVNPRLPMAFKSYYWEYLSIWANSLLGGEAGRGLIESQLFSQWLHVLGWLGSVLILIPIFRNFSVPWPWIGYAILPAANSWALAWTVELAKNDWGVIFWTLCGIKLITGVSKSGVRTFTIAGMFLGLAVGAKYTAVITVVPFVGYWMASNVRGLGLYRGGRAALFFSGAFCLALAPILIRNFALTGNPFFPIFDRLFSSRWLSQSAGSYYRASQWSGGRKFIPLLFDRLRLIAIHEPALIVLFVACLALPFIGKSRTRVPLYLCSLAGAALFLVLVGATNAVEDGNLSIRLMGPSLVLGLSAGVLALFDIFLLLPVWWLGPVSGIVLTIFGIWTTRLPSIDVARTRYSIASMNIAMRTLAMGGTTKAWLRFNAGPRDLIVSTGDNQLYHVAHLRIAVVADQPGLDRVYQNSASFEDFLGFLLSLGTKYILDTDHFESTYWSGFSWELSRHLQAHPEAVLFESRDSRIVAPERLLQETLRSCSKPQDRLTEFEGLGI